MRAFHNDPAIKELYLSRVRGHREADELIHGRYWENGKGCAVGCTIHGEEHAKHETELGIPRILARLEDRIFEGLEHGLAKDFPEQFLSAIPVGADLSLVWHRFAHWMLIDEQDGVVRFAKKEATRAAIVTVGELFARAACGEVIAASVWSEARSDAAYAYAYAAAAAAYAYADADADADAAAAAYAYAYAYAYADADADADADAYAYAYAYAYADADADAARKTTYKKMAEKLVHLLSQAPVPEVVA